MPVNSCPKCGAMIVPQLSRCRQCKTYLHGTSFEGFVLEKLLPEQMQRSPGTVTLCFAICLYYVLMIAGGGEAAIFGFSHFTLEQLGATHGPSILLGQYWRFVTSIFGHHDLLHLALNLSSLVAVGDIVERVFDRKKMWLIYLGSGVTSMMISHIWYVHITDQVWIVSAGASGAVCGLIGAAWFGAKKLGPQGADLQSRMKRWAIIMVIWGFAVPGVNNAAHFGGFAVGALLAHLTPAGMTQTVQVQRILSIVTMACAGVVLGCTVLMIQNLRGFPTSLADDEESRSFFGRAYYEGRDRRFSDQTRIRQSCIAAVKAGELTDDGVSKCELDVRVNDIDPGSYMRLAWMLEKRGDAARAAKLRAVADRIRRV